MPLSRIHLVACAKTKLQHAAPAKALYASAWFRRARAFAEASGALWYILSAEHGLLDPEAVIAPYEAALSAQTAAARRAWAERVAEALTHRAAEATTAVILAGRAHRDPLAAALSRRGVNVEAPLAGLGLGQQLAWFDRQLAGAHWAGVGEAVLPAAPLRGGGSTARRVAEAWGAGGRAPARAARTRAGPWGGASRRTGAPGVAALAGVARPRRGPRGAAAAALRRCAACAGGHGA